MGKTLTKKMFNIGLDAYRRAKKCYRNGAFVYASDSAFLRALLEDIITEFNKR